MSASRFTDSDGRSYGDATNFSGFEALQEAPQSPNPSIVISHEIPRGGIKRHTTKKIKLIKGSVLSVNCPVPSAIRNAVQPRYRDFEGSSEEFVKMRYTAATCDPDEFTLKNGHDLRPRMYNRHTELFVCVTYFNEDKYLFARSWHSIMENVRDIINLKKSTFWNKGGPAWQKIVLCVAMDGIEPCDKVVLDHLATVGVYQDGILKKEVAGRETVAHIFEYTTQLSITPYQQLIRPIDDGPYSLPPVQIILCLKQKNSGKINSNRWFLNAFGRILNPEVVVHIDTGTRINPRSLLKLWGAFYNDRTLGGACGVIEPALGKGNRALLNPLVATQNFEYKVACQLERAIESTTGYLSVLPGAFSAYRFRAIIGTPMEQYFRGDPTLGEMLGKNGVRLGSIWRLNRFLADDRIMAFELLVKHGQSWSTRLVPAARGRTDVPTSTVDFINQRRRWLNGSLSASIYSMRFFLRFRLPSHNIIRLCALFIQMAYNLLAFILAWFSLAGYLLTTFVVNDITGDPPGESQIRGFPFGSATKIVNSVIQIVYLGTVVLQVIIALAGRPKGHRFAYVVSFGVFAVVQLYLIMNLIYLTKRLIDFKLETDGGSSYGYISEYYSDIGSVTVLVTAVAVFGVYIAAGIISLDPWHLVHSWAQYLFISSSYTNILKIYAFSNIHDSSWGVKSGKKDFGPITPVPPVPAKKGNDVFVDDVEKPQEDIDTAFENVVKRALEPHKASREPVVDDREETFLKFRTALVASYLFSNFFVCIIIMNDSLKGLWWLGDSYWHKIWFFRLWMWGNSSLLLLQLFGCIYQAAAGFYRACFYRY
ncbi:chitin synthase 1 [Colletotrichum incanum]|nr:chitin synthase 1 [Colletotrichum incanum]